MSVTNIYKDGMFDKTDCPYSATAIEAVKEMQDFNNKSFSEKAEVVWSALLNKNPSFKWYVVCHKEGYNWHSTSSSVL